MKMVTIHSRNDWVEEDIELPEEVASLACRLSQDGKSYLPMSQIGLLRLITFLYQKSHSKEKK